MKILRSALYLLIPILLTESLHAGAAAGEVVSWGDQLIAVSIAGETLTGAVAVAAGNFHSLALKADGTVIGWGWNAGGQAIGFQTPDSYGTNGLVKIGGRTLSNVVAIAAGNFSLGLKSDGTLVAWGKQIVPSGLSNVVAIAARGFFSVALKSDGTVFSWGSAPWNQTHVPAGLSNVVAVAAGGGQYERSMALKKDGTVVAWKSGLPNEEPVPTEVTNVTAIAAGRSYSLALKKDGTVIGWGFNRNGQATGVPTENDPFESTGLVTIDGQPLTNVVAISAGDDYGLALKSDGRVAAWGNPHSYRSVPADLTNVVAIAAGDGFCLAIQKTAQ